MKGSKKSSMSTDFTDLETMIQGQVVNMEFLLLQEIRDIDNSVGSPFYKDRVKILLRTIESHPKIIKDKEYWEEMKTAVKMVDDKKAKIRILREPGMDNKKIPKIEEIDYEKIDEIARKYLAKHSLTFKKERHVTL